MTVKARRADERDTDKVKRGIDADIRSSHRTVAREQPMAISVRNVVIKTIKRQERLILSPPTMTSAEDVAGSSPTTHRSRHLISVPRVRLARLARVHLVWPVANVRSAVVTFPMMRTRSKDRLEVTRLSVVRFVARAVMDKRAIANFRLAVEVSGRHRRLVR